MDTGQVAGMIRFAEEYCSDSASLLRYLERHKAELSWAVGALEPIASAAARDTMAALDQNGTVASEDLACDVRRNLGIVSAAVRKERSGESRAIEKQASSRTSWMPMAQLVVSVGGLIVGTSTGLWGRLSQPARPAQPPVPPLAGPVPQNIVIHGVQMLVILFFVLIHRRWLREIADGITDSMPIARKTLKQFTIGWLFMWYGWLGLYLWFFIAAIASLNGVPAGSMEAVSDILDAASGFAIWWCFFVLDIPSVSLPNDPDRDATFREAVWLAGLGAVLCAGIAAGDRLYHWGYFGVALVGIYNGLALACLAGRFGSHYIGTPRWMLLLLYFYAMLQIFYSFLPVLNTTLWVPAVFLMALVLKIVLAWAGTSMMQHGGLRRYLEAAQSGLLNATTMTDEKWKSIKACATS